MSDMSPEYISYKGRSSQNRVHTTNLLPSSELQTSLKYKLRHSSVFKKKAKPHQDREEKHLQSIAKTIGGNAIKALLGYPTTHQILVAEEVSRECCVVSAVVLM